MNAEIRVVGDATGAETADLGRWLSAQRGLTGRVAQIHGAVGEQELSGGAVEILSVALGSGGVGSALAGGLSTWLGNRKQQIKLAIGDKTAEFPAGTTAEELARYFAAVKGEGTGA